MEKEEVLEKAKKKAIVGEMEKQKINSGNWIAIIIAGIVAIGFIIVEGCLGHKSSCFMIGAICFAWASSFYIMQMVKTHRSKALIIGVIGEGLGFAIMLTNYILTLCGVI